MTTDELKELYEKNKRFQEAVERLQLIMSKTFDDVMIELCKAMNTLEEQSGKLAQAFNLVVADFQKTNHHLAHRPPATIKKELKHEKNPMRVRQLNKELTESCRYWKDMIK